MADMHVPYENQGARPDFLAEYEFIPENLATARLHQGMKSDWRYADRQTPIYMIWPQFIDADRTLKLDKDAPIAPRGLAAMFIRVPNMRAEHRQLIREGTRGFLVMGPYDIASATVTKVLPGMAR